jgi:hypothetical protein
MEPFKERLLYLLKSMLRLALRRGTCARQSRRVALDPKFHGAVAEPSAIGGKHLRELKGRRCPAKVSRTEPLDPGALKTARTFVPSAHRYVNYVSPLRQSISFIGAASIVAIGIAEDGITPCSSRGENRDYRLTIVAHGIIVIWQHSRRPGRFPFYRLERDVSGIRSLRRAMCPSSRRPDSDLKRPRTEPSAFMI